jgi:hypothetical protein
VGATVAFDVFQEAIPQIRQFALSDATHGEEPGGG